MCDRRRLRVLYRVRGLHPYVTTSYGWNTTHDLWRTCSPDTSLPKVAPRLYPVMADLYNSPLPSLDFDRPLRESNHHNLQDCLHNQIIWYPPQRVFFFFFLFSSSSLNLFSSLVGLRLLRIGTFCSPGPRELPGPKGARTRWGLIGKQLGALLPRKQLVPFSMIG